jgi:hypothetical protein
MRPRRHKPANDNSAPAGSSVLANNEAPNDGGAMKNILGFFELLDSWNQAANDNHNGMTGAEATETTPHER